VATLLSTLVSDIRLLSGLRANQLYTNADIGGIVSDLWAELYDRFVAANQHYSIQTFEFTLAGGVGGNSVDLPSNFQLGNGLELNPSLPRPQSVRYLDNWLNRNNLGASVLNIGGGLACSDRQYCFNNNQLLVFPATSSAGDYKLYYTPMAEKLLEPITVTFALDAADHPSVPPTGSLTGSGSWSLANADFNADIPEDSSVILSLDFDAPNTSFSGDYPIVEIGLVSEGFGEPTASCDNLVSTSGFTGPAAGTGTYTYQPIGTIDRLSDYADPWAVYLKLGASIAIREARQQDVADLERRFNGQKLRVDQMLQNRQEEPTQPPLTSGRSFWDSL